MEQTIRNNMDARFRSANQNFGEVKGVFLKYGD